MQHTTTMSLLIDATSTVILSNQRQIASAFAYLVGVEYVLRVGGMTATTIGVMAWAMNKQHTERREWGRWMFGVGLLFTILGFNLNGFLELVLYAIGT